MILPLRWLALLGAALFSLALTTAPASAARPTSDLFGAGDWAWPSDQDLEALSSEGVQSWRTSLDWGAVEAAPGRYDFSGYDELLRKASERRIRVLLTITGCPPWACAQRGPPRDAAATAAFLRFVSAAVSRYGHLSGSALPITHWQVLNEVNGEDQWPSPDPAAYAALLKATNAAIKTGDPQAKTVLSGLPEKMTIYLKDYLPALYAQPGFAADFDVMAVHGYSVSARGPADILELTRRTMDAAGDPKPIWMTELGWATGGPPFPLTVGEAAQETLLRESFTRLAACSERWNLQRVFWFSYRDRDLRGEPDYWGFHNGLRRLDGSPKPAHDTFLRFVRRQQAVPRRCPLPGPVAIASARKRPTVRKRARPSGAGAAIAAGARAATRSRGAGASRSPRPGR